jgi:phospholipid/cholesterol/gamma-HCH transport system substrate-binding protein
MHYVHKLSRKGVETIVGLFVVFTILIVAGVIVAVGLRSKMFEKDFHLASVIKEGHGIQAGTVVKLAGIDIGEVEDVVFTEENKIKVTMKMRKRFQNKIRKDSQAMISSSGLVGTKHINISLGGLAVPVVADGDTITMIEPVEIGDLGARLNSLIEKIDAILAETYSLTSKVNKSSIEDFNATLKNVRQISADIKNSKAISMLNDEKMFKSFQDSVDKLNATMDNFKNSSAAMPGVVKKADMTMDEVNKIVKALQKHWLIRAYIKDDAKQLEKEPAAKEQSGAADKKTDKKNGKKK